MSRSAVAPLSEQKKNLNGFLSGDIAERSLYCTLRHELIYSAPYLLYSALFQEANE